MSLTQPVESQGLLGKSEEGSNAMGKMFVELLACTFQTVFGYICLDFCVAISLHYTATLGSIENASFGFAYTCSKILIIPFGFGLNQSLNMHAAQALGSKKVKLAKRYLTLNGYLLLITLIPLSGLLLALKQPFKYVITEDKDLTSDTAQVFLYYILPASLLAVELESVKTFMIANKTTYPFTIIHLITTCLHWLFTWLFFVQFDWGINGAASVLVITEVLNILILFCFIQFTSMKDTIFKDVEVLIEFKKFLSLGKSYLKSSAAVVLHMYSEFFVYFCLSFVAISLGTNQMNAHLGVQNTVSILFKIPTSLSLALMSYVGNEMGCGNLKKAQRYVVAGIIILFATDILIVGLLYIFQESWADFYSGGSEEVRKLMNDVFPWMIYGIVIADGFQGTISGALKGINQINLVFYSTIIAYYMMCIPLVFWFSYAWGLDQGVVGIWQAFGLANFVLLILYASVLFYTDWSKESQAIQRRVENQNNLRSTIMEVTEKNL